MEMERCHFWLARFRDEELLESYFAEPNEYSDREPINHFARDQHKTFYDHDFVFVEFDADGRLEQLCELIRLPAKTRDELLKRAGDDHNAIIAGDEGEFDTPLDVEGDPMLTYVGCFPCFVRD